MQYGGDFLHSPQNEGVHFRFLQIGILTVQVFLALEIEVGDVDAAVVQGIGAEFLHEVIAEAHSAKVCPEGPESGMVPEVFVVQIVPVFLDLSNLGPFIGRLTDVLPERGPGDFFGPESVRQQMAQIA